MLPSAKPAIDEAETPRVGDLRVFPIKSCGSAAALGRLAVDHLGPQYDRCLMVCHKPHWNIVDYAANSWGWQDSWGALTPRTPKQNSLTKSTIDGPSLLLTQVEVHSDATLTLCSKNASRAMPSIRFAARPPADAPLIENVPSPHHQLSVALKSLSSPFQVTRWESNGLKAYEIEAASKWFAQFAARVISGQAALSLALHVPPIARC
jgi:hypothetical protein